PSLRPAQVLIDRGDQLGSRDAFEEALEAFRAAARADRHEPHAHYEAGVTLLSLQRYAEAVEAYEATEALAPGWFHCRADLWLAQQLALGNLDHETFLALHVLEDGELPPEEKVCLAAQALSHTPRLAPLHLLHGQ